MNLLDPNRKYANLDGTWKDKDVNTGVPGTLIDATTFNQLGKETNNIIKAGGFSPNIAEDDQLIKSIRKLINDKGIEITNAYKQADNLKFDKSSVVNSKEVATDKVYGCKYINDKLNTIARCFQPYKDNIIYANGDIVIVWWSPQKSMYKNLHRIFIRNGNNMPSPYYGISPIKSPTDTDSFSGNTLYYGGTVESQYWEEVFWVTPPKYYEQYPRLDGSFNSNDEPYNHYYLMGVYTEWELVFNTQGVFFRTEGGNADSKRSGLTQGDAGRNILGQADFRKLVLMYSSGFFETKTISAETDEVSLYRSSRKPYEQISIDMSKFYTVDNEFRPVNAKKRIWRLKKINSLVLSY